MSNKIDLSNVPQQPGCYLWKDSNDQVIYVGKAKNLKKRMSQYFLANQSLKNSLLVKNIETFDYITTISDQESFILETQLIHEYEPKYNIKVKHSGFTPYIILTDGKEKFLRLEKKLKQNSKYKRVYGPFPIEFGTYTLIKILNEILPFNKCLNPGSNIPCLYYQMGMCLGHCIKTVNDSDYEEPISKLDDFFKGDTKEVEEKLTSKINYYSEQTNYEQASKLVKMLNIVRKFSTTNIRQFNQDLNADFFSWYQQEKYLSISISFVRFGKFIRTDNYINAIQPFESVNDVIENFIFLFYLSNQKPKKLFLQEELVHQDLLSKNVLIPLKGINKDFISLSYNDAVKRLQDQFVILQQKELRYNNFLSFLSLEFNIEKAETFELIDISSFQGENQVGAVVSFKNSQKDKKMYRKYIIKDVDYQDDYASIREVVYRHFRNKLIDKIYMPDVLIIDGGKGQLNAAKQVLDELNININLMSLKKNTRHKTSSIIFYKGEELKEISLSKLSQPIQDILIGMQDEIHRFVLKFNRTKRSETLFDSSLNKLSFLNEKDIKSLYDNFGTIHQMLGTNEINLEKVISKTKAKKLLQHFESLQNKIK